MFIRHKGNPIINRKEKTFHSIHAANPDILKFNNKLFYYFRGQGDEKHDQIGVAFAELDSFNGYEWNFYKNNPIIAVSNRKGDFDSRHILDPGTVVINGKVHLYYSGHSYDKPACVGLAISHNGIDFEKHKNNPVILNAIAPEVVIKNKIVYLFYQKKNEKGYFELFCSFSNDGVKFINEKKVFGPDKNNDSFDSFSISTCRIWKENENYYMIYGGSDKFDDYPHAFGLAKSTDLLNWSRYPLNPVFTRGEAGAWDEGGIWFGTVYKYNGKRYMWYEGCGTGFLPDTSKAKELSDKCRNEDYGGYGKSNFSQIGMAVWKGDFDF